MALRNEVVDQYGQDESTRQPRAAARVDAELVWKGNVPYPGLWHFVAEVRSPGTTQVLKRAYAKIVVPRNGYRLLNRRGTMRSIETDTRLSRDWVYHLGDRLEVGGGATLTIDAGTLVKAFGRNAGIVVRQGGRIAVMGRREAPVVMTCSLPVGRRHEGCWAGLAVLGQAPVGGAPGPAGSEPQGGTVSYGTGDPGHSSGELRYLRVEIAGGAPASGEPPAALSFQGVGSGTVIDHVQVHASAGDGIAFQGGTAHCRYCVSGDTASASMAWSQGWRGSAQHLYVQQGSEAVAAMRGSAPGPVVPGHAPTLYNVTLVGGYNIRVAGGAPGSLRSIGPGILLEREAAITARNLLAVGFPRYAIEGSAESFRGDASSIANAILTGTGIRYGSSKEVSARFRPYVEHIDRDPDLLNIRHEANPDPRPRSGSEALRLGNAALPPFDRRFSHAAHYVGAFGRKNWLEEWTFFGAEQDYQVPDD